MLLKLCLIFSLLTAFGCGAKKSVPVAQMSSQFKLDPFSDVNKPSTLDLDKLKDLPRVIDLKDQMSSVKNQGTRGTCTFFSNIALAEAAVKKTMNVEVNFSEEYLNYLVKSNKISSDEEGSTSYQNIEYLIDSDAGFLLERDWPYQPTWFQLKAPCKEFITDDNKAPAECYSHNAPPAEVKAKEFSSKNFSYYNFDVVTTNEFIEALAKYKQPMAIGVVTNSDGWLDNGEVSYTQEMRQACLDRKADCGAHAIVLTGYDLDKRVFFFKNSWGKHWGKEGFGIMPFDYVDRHSKGYFSMIDLDKNLDLPKNHAEEFYSLNKFTVKSQLMDDSSVNVHTGAEVKTSGLYSLIQSTRIVKISKANYFKPIDENTSEIYPTDKESEKYKINQFGVNEFIFADQMKPIVGWSEESTNVLRIPGHHFSSDSIRNASSSEEDKILLKTTIYIYTDNEYKLLKRHYHPINFK